jgi:Skp family chaperone for outer membrane proteins
MAISSRAILTVGWSLVGVVALVGPSLGQQPDREVRRATNTAPAPKGAPPAPAIIGSVDLDAVFRGYDRVKDSSESFKAEAAQRQNDLIKIADEGKRTAELLAKLSPNQPDYKKYENQMANLKAKLQVGQEQAASEFAQKEADALAMLYKDIQKIVAGVAKQRGFTYVIRVNNDPVAGSEPQSVMAAMSRAVLYSDPTTDITSDVIYYLNYYYHQQNPNAGAASGTGTKPGAAGSSAPAPSASSAPAKGNK